jgi:hypothetical protein
MLMITLVCDDCHTGAIGLVPYRGGDGIRDVCGARTAARYGTARRVGPSWSGRHSC